MSNPDLTSIAKFAAALRSLPLWMFIACALCGYAALFLPSFGGADLIYVRQKWSWLFWLIAVSMTIFSTLKLTDIAAVCLVAETTRRKERVKLRAQKSYSHIYQPLMNIVVRLHAETVRTYGAPRFIHRCVNAKDALLSNTRRTVAVRKAWKALWDRQVIPETGEMSFGGSFPIEDIQRIVYDNTWACDDRILTIVRNAERVRIEKQYSDSYLTEYDCELLNHIEAEHNRLKRILNF